MSGFRCRELLRETATAHEMVIHAGSVNRDHVHMLLSIPPKYAVAQVVGYVKGKSAIYIARTYGGRLRNFLGEHFWARGYFVSTVGRDEEAVRQYIRAQEAEERRLEQLELFNKKKK
jgi:putative transposase